MEISKHLLLWLFCLGAELPASSGSGNCQFEDTVNLTNAQRYSNGSYLYDNAILIPAHDVDIYDYEEVFDGNRISVDPHPRGCLCHRNEHGRLCAKFCCNNPAREFISHATNQCEPTGRTAPYSPYFDVAQANGSALRRDVTKDFVVIAGIPCDNAYPLDVVGGGGTDKWQLFENGSLSLYQGEIVLSKRDYCLMFAPKANGKEMILTPMICPVPVVNEEPVLGVFSSIADFITTIFISLTLAVYLLLTDIKDLQGKCFMGFLISLALGCIFLTIISLPDVVFPQFSCGFLGFSAYFCSLASFFWLNVACFHMLKTAMGSTESNEGNKRLFRFYSAYACGVPFAFTIILIIIQATSISDRYKSGIGGDYCWFDPTNWSAMIYFFGVNAFLLCMDFCLYFVVFLNLRTTLKTQPDSKEIILQKKDAHRYGVLLLIVAIACFFDISANVSAVRQLEGESVWYYISSFINAVYGIFIFVLFAWGPVKKWRHQRECLRKGYARDDDDTKNFENIEISTRNLT
uniref:G-protein coupled receptors family 2 profile 2 domain-containing protein n=1 Tax=Stomoxys calcitrans TaxID=35570 RepID=A0A1I8Q853_STOCA